MRVYNEDTQQVQEIPDDQLKEILKTTERVDGTLTKWEGTPGEEGSYVFEKVHIENSEIARIERFASDGTLTETVEGGNNGTN